MYNIDDKVSKYGTHPIQGDALYLTYCVGSADVNSPYFSPF